VPRKHDSDHNQLADESKLVEPWTAIRERSGSRTAPPASRPSNLETPPIELEACNANRTLDRPRKQMTNFLRPEILTLVNANRQISRRLFTYRPPDLVAEKIWNLAFHPWLKMRDTKTPYNDCRQSAQRQKPQISALPSNVHRPSTIEAIRARISRQPSL